jgi:hypothetical protein
MGITADNAANNVTFLKELEYTCNQNNIDFDYKKNHVRCLAHIINLTTQEILKYIKGDDARDENEILSEISENKNLETIPKLRKLIVKIRSSPQRREAFARRCDLHSSINPNIKSLNLILDVRTRWNSTYLMLDRALKLREVCILN